MPGAGDCPRWTADVPEPETSVVYEDSRHRAELTSYVAKGGRVKDVRVRGPPRMTRKEALKDGAELRRAALQGGYDPSLFHVRNRRKELESVKWKDSDLVGADVEDPEEEARLKRVAARRAEEEAREEQKRLKEKEKEQSEAQQRMRDQIESQTNKFQPIGPGWIKPGALVSLPKISHSSWMIHEKQDSNGKYRPWLYFNTVTGKYYRQKDSGVGYIQTGTPNAPRDFPIGVRVGSASLTSKAGKKLDMAVLLPELQKTGFLLKQPLEFLDRPSSLFVLCDGLRNSPAATEFCAKKFHTVLLPRLSARATEWEDFELVDIVRDAAEALDGMLMDSPACFAGCNFAVGLLAGTRLVVGALGGVRCVLCRPARVAAKPAGKPIVAGVGAGAQVSWQAQLVAGGDAHTTASEDERLRVVSAGNRLLDGGAEAISAGSARAQTLATIKEEQERLIVQVSQAANPFATLGVTPADLRQGSAAIRRIFRRMSLAVHPDKAAEGRRSRAVAAFAKLEAAATSIEDMLKADAAATMLMAEIDALLDEGKLAADPAVAAKLLGVEEGCGAKAAKEAAKKRFEAPLGRLQFASRHDVERAFKALEVAQEAVVRGTRLWVPPAEDEAVRVTRALGCRDLKTPVPLLSAGLVAECVDLEQLGGTVGLALLSDGAAGLGDAEVASELARHAPARPRAAALRLALTAKKELTAAVGIVCAYFELEGISNAGGGATASAPPAKKSENGQAGSRQDQPHPVEVVRAEGRGRIRAPRAACTDEVAGGRRTRAPGSS